MLTEYRFSLFLLAQMTDSDDDGDGEDNDGDDDIYIMMSVCLSVTKNHHFLLGVSCNHPGWFFMVLGRFLWFFMVLGQVL